MTTTARLGDLCDIVVGRTPSRSRPEFWGHGQPWLSIADLSQGQLISRTKEEITAAGAVGGKLIPPGTVVMSFKLSLGKAAITQVPLYTNEAIAALVIRDEAEILPNYLLRVIQTLNLNALSNRAAMGATLNRAILNGLPIPITSLSEQRRIAAILDQADAFRAKRRELLAHLDTLPQAILNDHGGYRNWPLTPLGEVSEMRNGVSPSRSGSSESSVLTLSAITGGTFDSEFHKRGTFVIEPSAQYRVDKRDFLLCRGNGNRELVGVGVHPRSDYSHLVFPDTVIAARFDPKNIDGDFLEVMWKQPSVRTQVMAGARTTNGTFKINQQTLAAVQIPLPSLHEQQEVMQRVASVHFLSIAARHSFGEADALFHSLQSRAFKGEL